MCKLSKLVSTLVAFISALSSIRLLQESPVPIELLESIENIYIFGLKYLLD
jgi:hypothetical protein